MSAKPIFRFSKIYPRDVAPGKATIQRDLSMYTHMAQISGVNVKDGTCSIRWVTPKPGARQNVLITHGSPGDITMPKVGDYVLVSFDSFEQARIISYVNLGHQKRVITDKTLPEFQQGDKFFESGGAYVWIRQNGDIILTSPSEGTIQLESLSNTFKTETVNWRMSSEAGIQYSGLVKRFKLTGTSLENISRIGETAVLTEHRIKVVETGDTLLSPSGLEDPLIDICLGTYVEDDTGNIVDKRGIITSTRSKELAVRLVMQNGVKIFIDKEGRVSLENLKLNINQGSVDSSDSDIVSGLETNNSEKGNKGQNVARVHDAVTIPIGFTFTNEDCKELETKNSINLSTLQKLASAIISPTGPCSLNTAALGDGLQLEGIITEGASDIYIGG